MKNLFKTKTFYAGLGQIIAGIGVLITGGTPAEAIIAISTGFGTIFMRHAVNKAINKND